MICLTVMIEGKPRDRPPPVASFAIRQECGPGTRLSEPSRHGNWPGAKIEVVGLPAETVEELWDAVTQARADLAGVPRK